MTPEHLHDAITLLPEDLLTQTDRLRQKKRTPWKSIAAVAACLCLLLGLPYLFPGEIVSMDAANGAGNPEYAPEMEKSEGSTHYSSTTEGALVEILSVEEDSLQVFSEPTKEVAGENFCIQLSTLTLTFENLAQIPEVKPGQTLRIYYNPEQFEEDSMTVKPYKIEIIEEETK